MELIATIAGIFALLICVKFGMLVRIARGLRLKRGECTPADPAAAPAYLAELRAPLEQELAALGFSFSHAQFDASPFISPLPSKLVQVYVNAAARSYAEVALSDVPEPARPFGVSFVTLFSNRTRLITMNGLTHGLVGELPKTRIQDPYTELLDHQWEAHRKALAASPGGAQPLALPPGEYCRASTAFLQDYIRSLLNNDWIEAVGDGTFRLRFLPACRVAFRLLRGEGKLKALMQRSRKRYQERQGAVTIPVELEVESYRRIAFLQEGHGSSGMSKLVLLAATAVLFALSFGASGSFRTVLLLTGALLVHEGGHFLGMRLFGYRDVKVLFLPFLGAVTTGREKPTPPHQRIIVYLLGPLPGILLGMLLLLSPFADHPMVNQAALILLGLNYLNLLPVVPLDGGRVFEIFFSRWPLLQIAFQVVCGLLLLGASTALQQDRVLFALGIMVVMNAVQQAANRRLLARLAARMSTRDAAPSEEALLTKIFGMLREKPHDKLPFARKFQTAKFLLNNAPTGLPSFRLIFLSSLAYAAVFVLPVILVAGKLLMRFPGAAQAEVIAARQRSAAEAPVVERVRAMAPDVRIVLTPGEEKLAAEAGIDAGILLRLKRLAGGEIKRLEGRDEQERPLPAAGATLAIPSAVSDVLVLRLREELLGQGYLLFVDEKAYGNGPDRVGLLKGSDPFEILRLKRTDGANHGHANKDVIARLQEWQGRTPFVIVGAGRDWVDIEFRETPADLPAFAAEVGRFCPDAIEQGVGSVAELEKTIGATKRLFLWWD
jgi:Zn-dependent protease